MPRSFISAIERSSACDESAPDRVTQATHLLKYDSTLGPFAGTVSAVDDHTLSVDGKHIRVRAPRQPQGVFPQALNTTRRIARYSPTCVSSDDKVYFHRIEWILTTGRPICVTNRKEYE